MSIPHRLQEMRQKFCFAANGLGSSFSQLLMLTVFHYTMLHTPRDSASVIYTARVQLNLLSFIQSTITAAFLVKRKKK